MHGRLLWLDDREPSAEAAVLNPSMAQYHLWLAQIQRDHGRLSDREMARMEGAANALSRRSKIMFNPFTGEVRRFDSNYELDAPTSVFIGGARPIGER